MAPSRQGSHQGQVASFPAWAETRPISQQLPSTRRLNHSQRRARVRVEPTGSTHVGLMDGNPAAMLPQLQQLLAQSVERSAEQAQQQAQALAQQAALSAALEHLASAIDRLAEALQARAV